MVFSPKIDNEIAALTENWIEINKYDDKFFYECWLRWRREALGCNFVPNGFTVPSEMPPTTQAAAKEYIRVIQQIRKLIGWNTTNSKLPKDPQAWMG